MHRLANLTVIVIAASVLIASITQHFIPFDVYPISVGKQNVVDLDWWKTGIIYQVYPRSFQDSNGDGIGDLQGINARLDYLVDLGVSSMWLNPVFVSPMADFGYDVSNHTDVDPVFGSLQDIKDLLKAAHEKGIRLILDFIPNHTSDEHEWFQRSVKRDDIYSDFYVWKDGKVINGVMQPPSNWVTLFNEPAWTWHDGRGQYYLHQFLSKQPDLNYENADVRQRMKDVLTFWMRLGVDGFRCDAIAFLYEREYYSDDPLSQNYKRYSEGHYDRLLHTNNRMIPQVYDMVKEWAELVNDYSIKNNKKILLITEQFESINDVMPLYSRSKVDLPFNFNLLGLNRSCGPVCLKGKIDQWMNSMPDGYWPNWVIGNHDQPRIGSVMGKEMIDVFNMLLLTLPGTPTTYYGEELGMSNAHVTWNETRDPFGLIHGEAEFAKYSRDPSRSPVKWDNSLNGGFTTAQTWLPLDHTQLSTQDQSAVETSHLNFYKEIVKLRKSSDALLFGSLHFCNVTDSLLAYRREYETDSEYVMVSLFDSESISILDVARNCTKHHVLSDPEVVVCNHEISSLLKFPIKRGLACVFRF